MATVGVHSIPIPTSRNIIVSAFRTDTDISQKKGLVRERELQAWQPDAPNVPQDETFGATGNITWDQFAVNEKLFGVKTNFDEEAYTTKLDRSAPDYKERERKAQRIANEILGVRSYLYL
jgi:PAB1-binding protein PBP1